MKNNIDQRISTIVNFYKNQKLPTGPIYLGDEVTLIVDTKLFIESHLNIIQFRNKRMILPYLERLEQFKIIISN